MTGEAPRLLLASASPRRSALLRQIGIAHRVHATEIDEAPRHAEAPQVLAQRLAQEKARAGIAVAAGLPVLGADTIGVLEDRVLGKPRDAQDAQAMLLALSGREHRVLSAVAVAEPTGQLRCALSESRVRLRRITPEEALWYWRSGEPRDKAGGYAIQGLAAMFIADLAGSFSGVMGLPLFETAQLLAEAGVYPATGGGT